MTADRRPQPLGELLTPWWAAINARQENPMKFRKKPVVVEARQFTGFAPDESGWDILHWIDSTGAQAGGEGNGKDAVLKIETLEGVMTAEIGDWIICGVEGEFYPCRDDIFRATYEAVEAS